MIPLSYTFAKPVIESNVLSVTECVEHGKTSLNFDVNYSKQLANYIIDLFENNSKYYLGNEYENDLFVGCIGLGMIFHFDLNNDRT